MEPDPLWETGWVQSLGQKANIVAPEVRHTCTAGRGRVINFAVISDSAQSFWRRITPEYDSPCKPDIGRCLQFTATPTQIRVRPACFPENFAFPKTVEQVVHSRKRMNQERGQVCLQGRALGISHAKSLQDTIWPPERGKEDKNTNWD